MLMSNCNARSSSSEAQLRFQSSRNFLLFGAGHFEHYVGSLTTPPCSESVQWYVATTFASVTDAQILDFMTATNGGKGFQINARPIQDFRNDEFKLDVL